MSVNTIRWTEMLFAIFIVVTIQGSCQSKSTLKTYETSKYKINYRSDWLFSNDGEIVNIYPKNEYGAVTISFYSGITFPLEETKSFILEMNQIAGDSPDSVKMVAKGELVEFIHDYVDKGKQRVWFTKAIRKGSDFFLITVNCDEGLWEKQKAEYFTVVESFKIKS
jgi:hypothetical protein